MWAIGKTPTPPNWPPPCAPQSVATAAAWRHQGRGRPAARRAAAGRCQSRAAAAAPARTPTTAPPQTPPPPPHPPPGGAPRGQSLNAASSNQPATGGQIQADPTTNSLIITAPDPQYRQLRAVIEQLDGRRAQVLVESLIVEISANKLAQFGVQWQSLLGKKGASLLGAV